MQQPTTCKHGVTPALACAACRAEIQKEHTFTVILPSGYSYEVKALNNPPVLKLYKNSVLVADISNPYLLESMIELLGLYVEKKRVQEVAYSADIELKP